MKRANLVSLAFIASSLARVAWFYSLNGLVGLVCGWLFLRRGLEHAMLAHFAGDLVLHVLVAG